MKDIILFTIKALIDFMVIESKLNVKMNNEIANSCVELMEIIKKQKEKSIS